MKTEWVLDKDELLWHKNEKIDDRYGVGSEHKCACGKWARCIAADFDGNRFGPSETQDYAVCETCSGVEVSQ